MRKPVDNVNHKDSPPSGVYPDAVVDLVHTVMHQFRSLQHQVLRAGAHDLTHMESKVLGFFERRPGATLSDLAQHSGRDKAQLARLVKGLRDRDFLRAEADAIDRRNVHLRLSDVGRAMQDALRDQGRALGTRAVDGLSTQEQAQLVQLLARVKANLDEAG